jgi:hypothetical protein
LGLVLVVVRTTPGGIVGVHRERSGEGVELIDHEIIQTH